MNKMNYWTGWLGDYRRCKKTISSKTLTSNHWFIDFVYLSSNVLV